MVDECHEYFVNDILVHNCIAWLLGHFFLTQGKNLDYYGFNTRDILSKVRVKAMANQAQDYEYQYMLGIRQEIDTITQKLQDEEDPVISARLEAQLSFAMSRIDLKDTEVLSLQELIGKIKSDKAERHKDLNKRREALVGGTLTRLPQGSYSGGSKTFVSSAPPQRGFFGNNRFGRR